MNKKAFIPISALLGALLLALVAAMTPFVAERNLAYAQMMDDIMYAENGDAPVATFTAMDPEGALPITWDIAAAGDPDGAGPLTADDAADGEDFMIDEDGVLKFNIAEANDGSSPGSPDFENPQGAGTPASNTYKLVVSAADMATGGETGYYAVTVMVTNVDETGKVNVATNTANGTPQYLVGATLTATAEDGDITGATKTFTDDTAAGVSGVTWRWYRGSTEIEGANTNAYPLVSTDVGHHIRAVVYYIVAGNTDQEMASFTSDYPVLAARVGTNELEFDPAAVSRTISEGDEDRNVGAPVTATGNHGTIRYTLGGTDVDEFEIDDKTGQITTAVDLNYEAAGGADDQCATANACSVTVTARDSTGEASAPVATVTITITDVDEKPTFAATSLAAVDVQENTMALFGAAADGFSIAAADGVTYMATDPETRQITYRLMGPDAAKFQLSATQVLSFKEDQEPDYEMPGDADRDNVYEVTVRANDGTMTADQMVKVTVVNEDEGPIVTGMDEISYAENGEGVVGTFMARDPEGSTSITWSLATDATIDGVEAGDVTDAGDFAIDDETGELSFAIGATAGASPDYENPAGGTAGDSNTYNVVVLAADGSTPPNTGYHKVMVKVTNLNEPGKITLATDTSGGTPQYLVGATLTATAEDGDITSATQTFTADIAGEVAGVTWRWYSGGSVITTATTNSYQLLGSDTGKHIRVEVRYQVDGNTSQELAQLTTDYPVLAARVGDNELEFDPATVERTISEGDEDRNVGAPVTATGNHGTIRYTLGGTDVDEFEIDDKTGQITTAVDLNYEAAGGADDQCAVANACVVTVTATDSTGVTGITATVNIAITNVDEKPMFTETAGTALSPELVTSPENRAALFDTTDGPVTTEAGVTYQATDPEGLNVNLNLMGPDAAMFSLSGGGVLSFKDAPDREMPGDANGDNMYEVTIRASDGTLTEDRMVKVTVTNVDEAPVISAGASIMGDSSISYAENGMDDVATYEAVGFEGSVSWTLSGDDAGDFDISSSGVLTFELRPDFEDPDDANTDNVYEITVMAGDGTDSAMLDVRVTVTDVENDMPTGGSLLDRYDADRSGHIDLIEVSAAIDDYFLPAGDPNKLSSEDMSAVIDLYFM